MRDWVVMLHARSSARLTGDERVQVNASTASTAPVKAVRVRNAFSPFDGKLVFTGLIGEAWGSAHEPEDAVEKLASLAGSYLQAAALGANACVDTPTRLLVYGPPTAERVGRFVEQRPCDPWSPAAKVRPIGGADLSTVIDTLDKHVENDRLARAVMHYGEALERLDPFNRLMSAQHLWIACENLGQAVLRRF